MAIQRIVSSESEVKNGHIVVSTSPFQSLDYGNQITNLSGIVSPVISESMTSNAKFGYEFTAGFSERTTGTAGASDEGDNFDYTSDMASSGIWKRFGFDPVKQYDNDQPYWSDPVPSDASGIGLFGGDYLPPTVNNLFDFSFYEDGYSNPGTIGSNPYTAASGSYDFTDLTPGSFVQVRFDFNITPQVPNTTIEPALIWQTRDANGTPTFTFALTAQPIYFGNDSVGATYLNRPIMTAYFASEEDVNARVLPAIKSNSLVQIQPLTTLCVVNKK